MQSDASTIGDLLDNFIVGTEKRKKWKQRIRTPPKASELGPISKINFSSTAKQASLATMRRTAKDDVGVADCAAKDDDGVVDCDDRATCLAEALKNKNLPIGGPFDWANFGYQCGVCFSAVPSGVSFLNGPLESDEYGNSDDCSMDFIPTEDSQGIAGDPRFKIPLCLQHIQPKHLHLMRVLIYLTLIILGWHY